MSAVALVAIANYLRSKLMPASKQDALAAIAQAGIDYDASQVQLNIESGLSTSVKTRVQAVQTTFNTKRANMTVAQIAAVQADLDTANADVALNANDNAVGMVFDDQAEASLGSANASLQAKQYDAAVSQAQYSSARSVLAKSSYNDGIAYLNLASNALDAAQTILNGVP